MHAPVGQQLPTCFPSAHVENAFLQETNTVSHGTVQKQLVQDGSGINANGLFKHHLRSGASR